MPDIYCAAVATTAKPVCVIVGATSKWQADGPNTRLALGKTIDDDDLPKAIRWGIGGALAQKFAREGFHVIVTTRAADNARRLRNVIVDQGHDCSIVELDLASEASVASAFARIRTTVGSPRVLIYNAGYLEGRALPPQMELLEIFPTEMFDRAQHVATRGPFLVAKEVLPAMREAGAGTLLFTNNAASLRGRKRRTGESLYYPRAMIRALSQVLTEEYSGFGVHVASVIIDGMIDSPGTQALPTAVDDPDKRTMPFFEAHPQRLMAPEQIADAFFYLHSQDRAVWTHELQLTPFDQTPSY
jgi:NAD(P)-dependent dehydrogenase (short-subunit alcohol dehydrogenase family)